MYRNILQQQLCITQSNKLEQTLTSYTIWNLVICFAKPGLVCLQDVINVIRLLMRKATLGTELREDCGVAN